jgi:hypothetical protein
MLIDGDYTGGLLHEGVIEKIFEREWLDSDFPFSSKRE